MGVDYHGTITEICLADDIVLLVELAQTSAQVLQTMANEVAPLGLIISWTKTKIRCFSYYLPQLLESMDVGTLRVDTVDEFIYLGAKLAGSCTSGPEIKRRLALWGAFGRLKRG